MGIIPRYRQSSLAALVALTLLASALSACGGDDGADGARPRVVATTGVAADIVARLGGAELELSQLVPEGANPHGFAPSARDQAGLTEADLVVYFSPALEGALPIDAAERSFAFADHAGDPRTFAEEEVGGAEDAGSADPHLWLDPTKIAAALPALAEALGEIDPAHATDFTRRATAYAAQLADLDRELQRITATIPPESRKLVSSHESLGYFADRYGLQLIGAPFGLAPEAAASAGELATLIDEVRAEDVPVLFAQLGDNPEVLRRIAEENGVAVVDDLRISSPGAGAGSYPEMMRFTAGRIATALGG